MMYFIVKALISGLIIAGVTSLADKAPIGGAFLKSLPITSFLVFFIMHFEGSSDDQIARMSKDIFVLVVPSLLLFISFPIFLLKGMGFYASLGIGAGVMCVAYAVTLKLFIFN